MNDNERSPSRQDDLLLRTERYLLYRGLKSIVPQINLKSIWQLGIGGMGPETVFTGPKEHLWSGTGSNGRLIAIVILANLAQSLLSVAYMLYNSLFSCMFAEREWSQLAYERKGLRVSGVPQGAQRSSYFLSLPYRPSIPIIALSAILHWLVSQALFVVAVERRGPTGVPATEDPLTTQLDDTGDPLNNMHLGLSWSPLALILILVGWFWMLVSALAIGYF